MGYQEGDQVFYVFRRGRRNSLKITFNAFFKEAFNLDLSWHIFVDSIELNTTKGFVQLFTIMTYMNKYDFLTNYYQFQSSIVSLLSIYIPSIPCFFIHVVSWNCLSTWLPLHWFIDFDHVKPSLVHDFFNIQSIGMIPLIQFKDVNSLNVYKKCENKSQKT
jgi:hypothetical protein